MSETPEVTVVEQPDRYQILVDGRAAGFTEYTDHGDQRVFPHTEIDPAYRGQGLAGRLIGQALDATRETGRSVIPECPAVARFIAGHAEYQDLVPDDRRTEFGL